ncbi:MAG: hypothetical protein WA373_13155 [Burkholderiales bacterium]
MALPENPLSLHEREEQIRRDSLRLIGERFLFREHLSMIHASMAVIHVLAHDHQSAIEDELTVQYLGLRLFNSAAASLRLSLSGYYQQAFALVRDVFETVALLDYMQSCPEQLAVWRRSNKSQRIAKFGPGAIRNAMNTRKEFQWGNRREIYSHMSEYAANATAPGFELLAPEGLWQIGPFLNEKYLKAWLEEIATYLAHGAVIFIAHFKKVQPPLLLKKRAFLDQVARWRAQCLVSS